MMKNLTKIALLGVCLSISALAVAQKDKNKNAESPTPTGGTTMSKDDFYKQKVSAYKNSLLYLDYGTATINVIDILTLRPEEKNWKDTLALLYFNRSMYSQTLLSTEELLKENPKHDKALEMQAIAYDALGGKKQSLESYEKLYSLSKNVQHLYQIAGHQFDLARVGECAETLNRVLADPTSEKAEVVLNYGRNEQQKVPMKAAIYNMRGVIAQSLQQYDQAKQNFDEAVKVFPEFVLAKGNLEYLEEVKKKQAEAPKDNKTNNGK